jgi:deoxyribodipyrimidine photo-lyase
MRKYNNTRNQLPTPTSRLSAYLKFGCVSIREVYWAFQKIPGACHVDATKQLFWREFYYNLTHEFPQTLSGTNRNFKPQYNGIPWITKKTATSSQKKQWINWVNGTTGIPIVDACMRELKYTGYMHNRGRLISASFLVKHLFWSWEEGERYFATSLIDYDPIVNNGNWQWVSGSGTDSQPYFRILNPWSQSKRFDPEAEYIHKWVPELSDVPPNHIHTWYDSHKMYGSSIPYPKPIVEHGSRRDAALHAYRNVLK